MRRCPSHCYLPGTSCLFILVSFIYLFLCPAQKIAFGRRTRVLLCQKHYYISYLAVEHTDKEVIFVDQSHGRKGIVNSLALGEVLDV